MGFWSSLAGSAGSGIGSGLTTGINSWFRGLDRDLLGGSLGIDKYNSYYLKKDTYDSAFANARASADAYNKFYPQAVKTQRAALEGAGYNPLLAVMQGGALPSMSAYSGSAIPQSSGSGGDYVSDKVRKEQGKLAEKQTEAAGVELEASRAESEARILEAENDRDEASAKQMALHGMEVQGMSPAMDKIRSNYLRSLESEGYTDSFGHKLFEDIRSLVPFLPSAEFGSSAKFRGRSRSWRVGFGR